MKIKSKLLAGGLMTVVACALVGSITGTFAWYQYSTSATASMRGVTVGSSRNLEFRFENGVDEQTQEQLYTSWASGNLSWNTIKTHLTVGTKQTGENNNENKVELAPVSNGANNGSSALNAKWYGNPNEAGSLPEVTTGFLQFSVYARLAETSGSATTYPAGKLYVTDIAGLIRKTDTTTADRNTVLENALRMHVQFHGYGQSTDEGYVPDKFFVVNPAKGDADSITLSATKSSSYYDWEAEPNESYILPLEGPAGTLVNKAHNTILGVEDTTDHTWKAGADGNGPFGTIKAAASDALATGVKITITLWLEGFTPLDKDGDTTNTPDDLSPWWTASTNVDQYVYSGLEFTGIKDVPQA